MSGDLQAGMKAVAMCVKDKAVYFAERLYLSMKVCEQTDYLPALC